MHLSGNTLRYTPTSKSQMSLFTGTSSPWWGTPREGWKNTAINFRKRRSIHNFNQTTRHLFHTLYTTVARTPVLYLITTTFLSYRKCMKSSKGSMKTYRDCSRCAIFISSSFFRFRWIHALHGCDPAEDNGNQTGSSLLNQGIIELSCTPPD